MRKFPVSITLALLAVVFIPAAGMAADPAGTAVPVPAATAAAAPAAATDSTVSPAPAAAPAASTVAPKKKKAKKKAKKKPALSPVQAGSSTTAIEAAVKIASSPISVRLDAIERKLDQMSAETVKLAAAPYPESLAFQAHKIRNSLFEYGVRHGQAASAFQAGNVISNLTWMAGTALLLAGYSNASKVDHPSINDYRLSIIGGGVIAFGQIVSGVCRVIGYNREGAAAQALQTAMQAEAD